MSKNPGTIASVTDALATKGFRYVSTSATGRIHLVGPLHAEGLAHECDVSLDSDFIEFPQIRLLTIPNSLAPVAPHLGSDGSLCYLAKGTVVIDIFDPVGQMLACLVRAEMVLGQLLRRELVQDLEEEFFAYWSGLHCFVDLQDLKLGRQRALLANLGGYPVPVVTDDEVRTLKKLRAIGWTTDGLGIPVFRIGTNARPRPNQNAWPPKTLRDVLQWQGILDSACRKKIEERVKEAASQKAGGVVLLIQSPLLTYSVFVNFRNEDVIPGQVHLTKKIPRLFDSPVIPMVVTRIDDKYLAERNSPGMTTLAGKRVVLVGCGTIGGFLADMLTKAGAGTGGGQLTLVDKELLSPANIGRHRLGFPSLLSNKATALADELSRGAPGADINALPVDVRSAHLGEADLLIDATGEESLSDWLTAKYCAAVPMLSVWIEGPGTAVRGLLLLDRDGACFHCLSLHVKADRYKSVDGELPVIFAGQGCEGLYVPFPATVSVQAACLGTEMVLDWLNGIGSPRLRTKITDRNRAQATADCNPEQFTGCPACSE